MKKRKRKERKSREREKVNERKSSDWCRMNLPNADVLNKDRWPKVASNPSIIHFSFDKNGKCPKTEDSPELPRDVNERRGHVRSAKGRQAAASRGSGRASAAGYRGGGRAELHLAVNTDELRQMETKSCCAHLCCDNCFVIMSLRVIAGGCVAVWLSCTGWWL